MIVLQILIAVAAAIGLGFILSDAFRDTQISRIQSHYDAWKKAEEKDKSARYLARRPCQPDRRQAETQRIQTPSAESRP